MNTAACCCCCCDNTFHRPPCRVSPRSKPHEPTACIHLAIYCYAFRLCLIKAGRCRRNRHLSVLQVQGAGAGSLLYSLDLSTLLCIMLLLCLFENHIIAWKPGDTPYHPRSSVVLSCPCDCCCCVWCGTHLSCLFTSSYIRGYTPSLAHQ